MEVPAHGGGAEYGFNDSSQEHFRSSPLEHTIRETIQNSLDAVFNKNKPVKVKMQLQKIKSADINANELKLHIEQTIQREKGQQEATKFYRNSMKIIKQKNISVLSIIDSNTSGLEGNNWNALVRSEGTPNKGNMSAAGGSFGIGKNAPYSISRLRLVCYATRYPGKPGRISRFMARCKLSSHPDPSKPTQMLQNIGFGCREFTRNEPIPFEGRSIPNDIFKLKERGTGVFIMAPDIYDKKWVKRAKMYVACHFFAAIHDKKLEVYIETAKIDNQTIDDIFREGKAKERSRHYYDAISAPQKYKKIESEIGNFEVLLCAGDIHAPSRVAYVNRRGMLITDDPIYKRNPFQAKLPWAKYAAVVRADNDDTDTRIREMEPPDHSSIQHDRIRNYTEHKKMKEELLYVQTEIKDFIESNCGGKNSADYILVDALASILHIPGSAISGDDGDELGDPEHRIVKAAKSRGKGKNHGGNGPGKKGGSGQGGGNGRSKDEASDGGEYGGQDHDLFDKERIIRSNDRLKIAFTPKDNKKSIKFAIKPAGEEKKNEDVIEISKCKSIAPPNIKIDIENNVITVNPKNSERIILEVPASGHQYTGYEIVEIAAAPEGNRES